MKLKFFLKYIGEELTVLVQSVCRCVMLRKHAICSLPFVAENYRKKKIVKSIVKNKN